MVRQLGQINSCLAVIKTLVFWQNCDIFIDENLPNVTASQEQQSITWAGNSTGFHCINTSLGGKHVEKSRCKKTGEKTTCQIIERKTIGKTD
ncbi:hypothetical protein [Marinicella meishanensis]|uniref:hypothetical protein n=1 Tax=Marinicella meishanensis TaxID=2873263 RepID=UPI001CBE000C|nr:hypothetical protein [Marinicella sp. NBU2979]